MDMSEEWQAELEMDDLGYMSCDQMDILYDDIDYFSLDTFCSQIYTEMTTNVNQEKSSSTINKISTTPEPLIPTNLPSSKSFTISFDDLKQKGDPSPQLENPLFIPITLRNPVQAQDHVLAERKRREKLNRHFVTLSNSLPKLKKMDKASTLEDATNYIKELQGRVKELEGTLEKNKRKNVDQDSGISSEKRSRRSSSDDEYYLSYKAMISGESTASCKTIPEIKVCILESTLTVSIQCQKNHSSFIKALAQMENLGLSIISSSSMPFAKTHLLFTIVARIVDDFSMTTIEVVKNLQQSIGIEAR